MAKFKCNCNDNVVDVSNLKMKIVSGEVVYEGVDCPECGEQMSLIERKTGVANFGSDRMGRVR